MGTQIKCKLFMFLLTSYTSTNPWKAANQLEFSISKCGVDYALKQYKQVLRIFNI